MITPRRKQISYFIFSAFLTLLLAACSGGGGSSGGSTAGTGSSSVEGTVTSVSLAMLAPSSTKDTSLITWVIENLLPITTAHADAGVGGIGVDLDDDMHTTTDNTGYFRFDGVTPGTHQISFTSNGQVARTSISVGDNELLTMQNISMSGGQAHVGSFSHTPMSSGQTSQMGPQAAGFSN